VALWVSELPQDQKTQVWIPPGYSFWGEMIAKLLCIIVLICIACVFTWEIIGIGHKRSLRLTCSFELQTTCTDLASSSFETVMLMSLNVHEQFPSSKTEGSTRSGKCWTSWGRSGQAGLPGEWSGLAGLRIVTLDFQGLPRTQENSFNWGLFLTGQTLAPSDSVGPR
jgi:hypothetical protein